MAVTVIIIIPKIIVKILVAVIIVDVAEVTFRTITRGVVAKTTTTEDKTIIITGTEETEAMIIITIITTTMEGSIKEDIRMGEIGTIITIIKITSKAIIMGKQHPRPQDSVGGGAVRCPNN